jgi:hypothetical protein
MMPGRALALGRDAVGVGLGLTEYIRGLGRNGAGERKRGIEGTIRDNGPERQGKKGAGKGEVWDVHMCHSCSRSSSHLVRTGLAAAEPASLCADADAVADHDDDVQLGPDADGDADDTGVREVERMALYGRMRGGHSKQPRRGVEPTRSENRAWRI